MGAGALSRSMHRVHRAFGSALALLLAVWFVSGAVMTFSSYPSYDERERLATAPALPRAADLELPPALARDLDQGLLAPGTRVRLAMLEGQATWLYTDPAGARIALRASSPWRVERLDAARARQELERRLHARVQTVSLLEESDQWTVGLAKPGIMPLFRLQLEDPRTTDVYVSARTGEIVQQTTRSERVLAWLGAIPHWIYPTMLRRERELWRYTVLALSALGLIVSLSGTVAGVHVWRATRKRRTLRDPALRWHQTIGLWFGLFVSTWLFSGALSLHPFQWTGERGLHGSRPALYGTHERLPPLPLAAALAQCQGAVDVRELELANLAGRWFAVCSGAAGQTRIIDLETAPLTARATVDRAMLTELANRLGAPGYELAHGYDAYHYPTHRRPHAALPYVRIALRDAEQTTYYLDPARASVLQRHTRATRLERWLYQGLHSIDLPGLYEHTTLWRTLVIGAMAVGFALSSLGLAMALRRWRRGLRGARQRERVASATAFSEPSGQAASTCRSSDRSR